MLLAAWFWAASERYRAIGQFNITSDCTRGSKALSGLIFGLRTFGSDPSVRGGRLSEIGKPGDAASPE